jgi:hypothetical protein
VRQSICVTLASIALAAAQTVHSSYCPVAEPVTLGMRGIRIDVSSAAYSLGPDRNASAAAMAQAVSDLPRTCPIVIVPGDNAAVGDAANLCKQLESMHFTNVRVTSASATKGWTLYAPGVVCTPVGAQR